MRDTERALLARIADGDDHARSVLADYWIEHGDEARGAFVHLQLERAARPDDPALLAEQAALWRDHGERWRAFAIAAGYPRAQLALERGFAASPLVVPEATPLTSEHFRFSPLLYREERVRYRTHAVSIIEARAATATGDRDRVLIESPGEETREWCVDMLTHPDPSGTIDSVGVALRPEGLAVVLPGGGSDLRTILTTAGRRARPLGPAFAASLAAALCERLAPAHMHGDAHKRVNPTNVLVEETGAITLLNLNRFSARGMQRGPHRNEQFEYMSPEQVRGLPLDPRSDVFSIAVLACALVTGDHPVRDDGTDFDKLVHIRDARLVLPPLPDDLEQVMRTALARAREDRYASGGDLRAALLACRLDIGSHVLAAAIRELRA